MGFIRVWQTVEEPRLETAVVVLGYLSAIVMSIWVLMEPPLQTTYLEPYIFGGFSVLLALGGILGVPTAWTGKWYVESIAATACLGGALLTLVDMLLLESVKHWATLSRPVITIYGTIFMVLFFAVRLVKTRTRIMAPGQGAETAIEISDRIRQDPPA